MPSRLLYELVFSERGKMFRDSVNNCMEVNSFGDGDEYFSFNPYYLSWEYYQFIEDIKCDIV